MVLLDLHAFIKYAQSFLKTYFSYKLPFNISDGFYIYIFQESKRHLGSLEVLGGIGSMVKEITDSEENEQSEDTGDGSGKNI